MLGKRGVGGPEWNSNNDLSEQNNICFPKECEYTLTECKLLLHFWNNMCKWEAALEKET